MSQHMPLRFEARIVAALIKRLGVDSVTLTTAELCELAQHAVTAESGFFEAEQSGSAIRITLRSPLRQATATVKRGLQRLR